MQKQNPVTQKSEASYLFRSRTLPKAKLQSRYPPVYTRTPTYQQRGYLNPPQSIAKTNVVNGAEHPKLELDTSREES